ncbi:LANO_0C06722g1_1 [Lachancea nothofagi CBS 11611]|uniref:LANO_0C06722g1_1 n=1 Tax=Lachancea nothofagi CBS 11611 TaxID=1266666 RepID=A0A1G4J821_9SACH|nr:LANO_0C06722g1_1 [Lachancea nothofagi CBS 11611]
MKPSHIALSQIPKKIGSIAVIGAGPVGAGLTKALIHENQFERIKVFEKRSSFGGVWNYTKPLFKSKKVTSCPTVPCETPHAKSEPHLHDEHGLVFQTAVYKYLDTNVPKFLMEYESHPFPSTAPLFPLREQVWDYIVGYSKAIENLVSFNHEVVKLNYNDEDQNYSVTTKDLVTGESQTENFDAVAIATGFYDLPFLPDRDGLKEWHEIYPTSVSHAKDFDCPEDFKDVEGEIIVVGNSASGSDLAFELATHLQKTVYKSKRSESPLPSGFDPRIREVADILRFDSQTKTVVLVNGEKIQNVEKVIFCTGYLKSLPFLPKASEAHSKGDAILSSLITDGSHLHRLYNHILPYDLPTIGIIGLPRFVLPTRLSETQGAWLARVWSGRIELPSMEVMKYYDQWFLDTNGDNGKYHDLVFPMDVQYSQRLNRQISAAGKDGYFGVEWTSDQIRIRSSIKPIKEGYLAYMKDTGKRAMNIEELIDQGYFEWPADALTSVQVPQAVP